MVAVNLYGTSQTGPNISLDHPTHISRLPWVPPNDAWHYMTIHQAFISGTERPEQDVGKDGFGGPQIQSRVVI